MQEFSILFPGQGSQTPGMGRDVADASSEAMELWKQAEEMSGLPLRGIFWEGSKEEMEDTKALQPGLTVVNLTLWQALSRKVKPLAVAGHTLGEGAARGVAVKGNAGFPEGELLQKLRDAIWRIQVFRRRN